MIFDREEGIAMACVSAILVIGCMLLYRAVREYYNEKHNKDKDN